MPRVFVVGSFVVGLTIRVPRMPVLGEGLIGDLFDMGIGGKGTNQALAAKRLGADVHLLACVGDDLFSEMAFSCYRQEGVSCEHIHKIPNVHTGVGLVGILPSGENWILGHLGANLHLRPEHVDRAEEILAESDIVMTQFEVPMPTMVRAMELGRRHGVRTLLNPAPGKRIEMDIFRDVDILTPNESETRILLGLPPDDSTPTPELADRLLRLGVKDIIVTQGRQGALIVSTKGCEHVAPVNVKPVDVTGAGDSFNAALAVRLGEGGSIKEAVQYANLAGAYTTQFLGVLNGLPTRAKLDAFQESMK
jgi:ribokinase